MRLVGTLLCAALLTAALSCDRQPTSTAPRPAPDRLDPKQVERLRELGYSEYSLDVANRDKSGVVFIDEARSCPGYNLVSLGPRCTAQLFDAHGVVVHEWADPHARNWDHCELLEGGDLLVIGAARGERRYAGAVCENHYLARYSWQGDLRWSVAQSTHHDVQVTPRHQLISLSARQRYVPEYDDDVQIIDNQLILMDTEGRKLGEKSLYDLLTASGADFRLADVDPKPGPSTPTIDLIHANSVEWMNRPELEGKHPIFSPANVLVCMRHQDSVAVIDWDSGRLVWSWGQGQLSGPHDARVLADGHLLIFDNGLNRGWSRVIELDPWKREIVWEYHAPQRNDFFSSGQGSSQRLEQGNTLIANSLSGFAFEVTPSGERVWQYLVPFFDEDGHRATMYRIRRYDVGFIQRLLSMGR